MHAVPERGLFTGNRGCLVDDAGRLRRHHRGSLWIICLTSYRGWCHPLDAPGTWTPLFFLDDAVGLAAGHRPCGLCRRTDYLAYRGARGIRAPELNRRLQRERLRRTAARGGRPILNRAGDRVLWSAPIESLPTGTVIVEDGSSPLLVTAEALQPFSFAGWGEGKDRPRRGTVTVLTPPTSVAALRADFRPCLHPSALSA